MAHCIRPIQFVPISEVVDEVCYRPRPDEVDAERRALSEMRRQMLPHERRLGRHKHGARVVAAARPTRGWPSQTTCRPGHCGGKRIRERRPASSWPRTDAAARRRIYMCSGSRQGQVYRPYSIRVSACVGLPGVGAGPARDMWEGQVALVRPWAAFGRPRGLERGHSGGSMYKVGFGRGRLLPTSVVLIDLY